jgi:hypothetical protein
VDEYAVHGEVLFLVSEGHRAVLCLFGLEPGGFEEDGEGVDVEKVGEGAVWAAVDEMVGVGEVAAVESELRVFRRRGDVATRESAASMFVHIRSFFRSSFVIFICFRRGKRTTTYSFNAPGPCRRVRSLGRGRGRRA